MRSTSGDLLNGKPEAALHWQGAGVALVFGICLVRRALERV